MKKITFIKSIIATLLIASSTFTAKADEGMWLIHLMAQTNYEAMKAKGVELSAEEIYSVAKILLINVVFFILLFFG